MKLMALEYMSVSPTKGEGNGSLKFSEEGSGSLRTSKGKIHSTSSLQPRALQVKVLEILIVVGRKKEEASPSLEGLHCV
jgi:hypothetical protein